MKLQPIGTSIKVNRFYLEEIYATEPMVTIKASDDHNCFIEIKAEGVVHFQVTDESYRYDTFMKFYNFPGNKELLKKHSFFKVLDDGYLEWMSRESSDFFNKKMFHPYVFFFSDSMVEIVCAEEPVCKRL